MELLPAHQQPVHVEVESILVEFGKIRFENMAFAVKRLYDQMPEPK
jgi:NADH:ubiquinone oxidoreductase subunit B-like Fe-S oxidoreductase